MAPSDPDFAPSRTMASIVERNIRALVERRKREDREGSWQHRVADRITRFTGSMTFVCIHVTLFGFWIIANLPGVPLPKFDPTYVILAMFASVEAIFLSTFVLISQNRMAEQQDKRAELDLQISLLAEHEVTQLLGLVKQIALQMGIEQANDPQLPELERDVAPEKVLDTLDQVRKQPPTK